MADQIINIGNNKRIVYRDGKSYLQVMAGGQVVSETQVTSSQAQEQIDQSREQPRSVTTAVERLTIDQLRGVISRIENIRPNAQGRYVYQGQTYTEGGIDNLLKPYKERLKELEDIARRSGEQAAAPDPGIDREIKRVNQIRTELSQKIQDLKDETRTVLDADQQDNLRAWITYYQTQFNRLTGYVDDLSSKQVRVGAVDTNFVEVSVEQAATRSPSGTSSGQPFTPGEGQGIFGEPISTPTVGGNAPVPGVVYGGMPTGAPMETASETPTPEVTPTPTAPSFTDPATGVTYQPGEMIGGEDRALPNGGAVVNGIYIPPGIDYAWLGQQVPEDWESAAKELYGAYYEMIKQYPELGSLIKNAIQQGWSDDKFQFELEQTNWWKTTSANTRNWETLLIQDPASAQVQLDNRTALLRDTAQRLGITLTSESLARIAEDSIKLGLELTSQLEDIVGSEALRSVGTVSQLRYGYVGNSIRESARKYGVSLSDTTFNEWVNKIAVGAESTETFESYAQQIARTLYPSLNNGFDRGLSFAQMTDPYAQVASRILEIPGAQVDFTNPKWAQAFTMKDDKGNPMQMSFGEWADYLRTDPSFGWEYTDDAKNRAYTVVNRLGELFGAA